MIKEIGDRLVARADATVDDEFERSALHRTSTVHAQVTLASTMVCMVILAWVLPGAWSLWSALLLAPALLWNDRQGKRDTSIGRPGSMSCEYRATVSVKHCS